MTSEISGLTANYQIPANPPSGNSTKNPPKGQRNKNHSKPSDVQQVAIQSLNHPLPPAGSQKAIIEQVKEDSKDSEILALQNKIEKFQEEFAKFQLELMPKNELIEAALEEITILNDKIKILNENNNNPKLIEEIKKSADNLLVMFRSSMTLELRKVKMNPTNFYVDLVEKIEGYHKTITTMDMDKSNKPFSDRATLFRLNKDIVNLTETIGLTLTALDKYLETEKPYDLSQESLREFEKCTCTPADSLMQTYILPRIEYYNKKKEFHSRISVGWYLLSDSMTNLISRIKAESKLSKEFESDLKKHIASLDPIVTVELENEINKLLEQDEILKFEYTSNGEQKETIKVNGLLGFDRSLKAIYMKLRKGKSMNMSEETVIKYATQLFDEAVSFKTKLIEMMPNINNYITILKGSLEVQEKAKLQNKTGAKSSGDMKEIAKPIVQFSEDIIARREELQDKLTSVLKKIKETFDGIVEESLLYDDAIKNHHGKFNYLFKCLKSNTLSFTAIAPFVSPFDQEEKKGWLPW